MYDPEAEHRTRVEALKEAQAALPPEMEAIVDALMGQIVDKWTVPILEQLGELGVARFTQIARAIPQISQKMLTQTLKRMERDGLVHRKMYPVMPPHVDYRLTELGIGLGMAFCSVWVWASRNVGQVQDARQAYDDKDATDVFVS